MPGGRSKSEGGPNDREAETAMLIEKAIMPLFPAGFNHNVMVSTCSVSTSCKMRMSLSGDILIATINLSSARYMHMFATGVRYT